MSIACPDINRSMGRIRIVLKRRMLRLFGVSCLLSTVNDQRSRPGFTLIEILLVMTIFATLFSFTGFSFLRSQTESNLNTTVQILVSDLKDQQIKAMSGASDGANSLAQGIFFETNRYILFSGNTYSAGDSNNFAVDIKEGINVFTTLPSSQIVFSKNSGEFENYISGSNTITVTTGSSLPTSQPTCNDTDVNNNGVVDIGDVFLVVQNFGTTNPQYDVNGNGFVEIGDVLLVTLFFGQSCPLETTTTSTSKTVTITINQPGVTSID